MRIGYKTGSLRRGITRINGMPEIGLYGRAAESLLGGRVELARLYADLDSETTRIAIGKKIASAPTDG